MENEKSIGIPQRYLIKRRYTSKIMDDENKNWREEGEYY